MKVPTTLFFIPLCLFFLFTANAGTPVNGTTQFNSVAAGVKAIGNAGTPGSITASDVEGFNFKLATVASAATMVIEVWDGAVSTGNGVAFYESTSSVNPLFSGITITANDGSRFDLNSIGVNAQSTAGGNATITIIGLDASGTAVPGASTTGVASVSALTVFNVSSINAFKGIYGIRITSTDIIYAFIDNINLVNVTVLPVKWLGFSAAVQNNHIILNWGTAFEQHTSRFIIQHSSNGTNWNNVDTLAAAGNSSTDRFYNYVHKFPFNGSNYYRLLQQDMDEKGSYSKVIYINLNDQLAHISVSPGVVLNNLLNVKLDKAATLQIFNSAGSRVILKKLQPGVQQVNLGNLPAGVYRIRAGNETVSFIIP